MPNQDLDDLRVFRRCVPVIGGMVGQTEPGVVGGDATKMFPQTDDDTPVEEAPGRVSVKEKNGRSTPLVEIVDSSPWAIEPTRFKGKQTWIGAKRAGCHGRCRGPKIQIFLGRSTVNSLRTFPVFKVEAGSNINK